MKKKHFQVLVDITLAIIVVIAVVLIFIKFDYERDYFYRLYFNIDSEYLKLAYLYETLCWLTIALSVPLFVALVSLNSIIFKGNSLKHNLIFIGISLVDAAILLLVNLYLAYNIQLHSFLLALNIILMLALMASYSFCNYYDKRKRKTNEVNSSQNEDKDNTKAGENAEF